MAANKPEIRKTDKRLRAFVREVTATLLDGKGHQAPGLGTFSTCTRKATEDRVACKMAMFRASVKLREYAMGGPPPPVSGPYAEVVSVIVEAMQNQDGVEVPLLGRMAVVPMPGKKPKLIFHGAPRAERNTGHFIVSKLYSTNSFTEPSFMQHTIAGVDWIRDRT